LNRNGVHLYTSGARHSKPTTIHLNNKLLLEWSAKYF
jgi:hypothetical protein